MARVIADWERCALNMSGLHTWHIAEEKSEKKGEKLKKVVRCHRCNSEPPPGHKNELFAMLTEGLERDKEARRMSAQWRKATGR